MIKVALLEEIYIGNSSEKDLEIDRGIAADSEFSDVTNVQLEVWLSPPKRTNECNRGPLQFITIFRDGRKSGSHHGPSIPRWSNDLDDLPSGELLHNYGKTPFSMGKTTINGPLSIAMLHYQRVSQFGLREIHINGKIHYFDWAMFKFANCNKLLEGIPILGLDFSIGHPQKILAKWGHQINDGEVGNTTPMSLYFTILIYYNILIRYIKVV